MMLNYPLLLLQSNSNFTTLGPLLDPISKLRQRPTIPLSLLSLSLSSVFESRRLTNCPFPRPPIGRRRIKFGYVL